MGRSARGTALALATLLAMAGPVGAQRRSEPHGSWGLSFVAAEPVGDLALLFDQGFGGQLDMAWPMSSDGHLRLHTDLGVLIYGYE